MLEEPCFSGHVDFSHLGSDVLSVIFKHVFAPGPGEGSGLPLSEFLARWQAVQRTCKHWQEVLLASPPPLHLVISSLPEAWLPWLLQLPVVTLRVQQGLDPRWSTAQGPPPGMPAPLPALELVRGLEGAGGERPFWSLAPLTRLRQLHLQAPASSAEQPAVFDSAALQGLEQLTSLSLGSFADFRLDQLTASLCRLRLCFDSQARTLSVPALPDHISLDLLRVEKPGPLGVCIDDFWGRVQQLEAHAQELLLGVPVGDRRLVTTFERPYREGNFVPPHIWGDEEADDRSKQAADMTANHLLSCLSECGRLQRLCLSGPGAASVKFMPVAPARRQPSDPHAPPAPVYPSGLESLQWLWSVVRLQGMHNLFGLSGQEMEARKQLFGDHLQFELAPERCCIHVARGGDAHAARPPGPGAADA